MHITAIGISHKTAPIDIREKFYLDETRRRLLLSELKNNPAVVEAIVLSTCNRTEIYAHTIVPDAEGILLQTLFKVKSIPFSEENGIDRKSTRLNSSHLVISYVVFSMKKH